MSKDGESPLPECHGDDVQEIATKWSLATTPDKTLTLDELLEELARRVAILLARDRRAFFQSLYRLDVSEEKTQHVFRSVALHDQPRQLARLVLEREIAKARTRRMYSAPQQDLPKKIIKD